MSKMHFKLKKKLRLQVCKAGDMQLSWAPTTGPGFTESQQWKDVLMYQSVIRASFYYSLFLGLSLRAQGPPRFQ